MNFALCNEKTLQHGSCATDERRDLRFQKRLSRSISLSLEIYTYTEGTEEYWG